MLASSGSGATGGSYIQRQMRRASRDLWIWNGIVLAAILAGAWFSENYYYYFFTGPVPMNDAAVLTAAQKTGGGSLLAYIELKNRELTPTGFTEESTSDDAVYSVVPYFFTPIGDKLLLVKTYSASDGTRLLGPLQRYSGKVDIEVRGAILKKHPELSGRILPVLLNGAAAFKVAGYVGLAIAGPLILLCGFNFARAWLGLAGPPLHPVTRTLARFGEPQGVADKIDQEVSSGPACQFGKVTLTSLWILRPTPFGLIVVRLADVVWAYHLVLNGKPMAVVCLRSGKAIGIHVKNVPNLLAEISARVPWIERGYDSEQLAKWRKRRTEFIAEVDERRSQQLAG